jgi:hypothetical protein
MKIIIESIPHGSQRYETSGDWWFDPDGTVHIKVSEMKCDQYTALVAVHELIEVLLCRERGISQEAVDAFDMAYTGEEPGDDPMAPYHREHDFASVIERALAHEMGVDWNAYNDAFEELS